MGKNGRGLPLRGPLTAGKRRHGKIVKTSIHGFAQVEFTPHCQNQMKIRGITEKEVLRAIKKPTRRGLKTQPGRKRVRKHKTTRKAIDVVYEEAEDRIVVITAFPKVIRP